jgi:hypothetical protein
MTDGDHVWQPMATAPRDRTLLVVKLAPGSLNRKPYDHIARWDDSSFRSVWRSYTTQGVLLRDERCVGWKPLDDAGREFLKRRRERARDVDRKRRAKGKRPPLGSSSHSPARTPAAPPGPPGCPLAGAIPCRPHTTNDESRASGCGDA